MEAQEFSPIVKILDIQSTMGFCQLRRARRTGIFLAPWMVISILIIPFPDTLERENIFHQEHSQLLGPLHVSPITESSLK